jgi:hypothetical protein
MQMQRGNRFIGKVVTLVAVFLALGLVTVGVTAAAEPRGPQPNVLVYTPLTLVNGWTNAPFQTRSAAVAKDGGGIVHFKGAIATAGTNPNPFRLPTAFRPNRPVFVATTLCGAAPGRLEIDPGGNVFVEPMGSFSDAQCFTSLEGVSYAH